MTLRILSLIFLIYAIPSQILGQGLNASKSIVLINGAAQLVDLQSDGTIVAIYQAIPDYFTSSESHEQILARVSGKPVKASEGIVFYEKEEEPVPSFTEENKRPILTGASQFVGFSPGRAILTAGAVDQLRTIAKAFQAGSIADIAISSYHRDNYRSRSIARNRADAIRDLLGAFGVNKGIVSIAIPYGGPDVKVDFVRLEF